jgi:hypothetical protein
MAINIFIQMILTFTKQINFFHQLNFDQLIIIDSSQHCIAQVTKEPHSQWTKFQHEMKTLKNTNLVFGRRTKKPEG